MYSYKKSVWHHHYSTSWSHQVARERFKVPPDIALLIGSFSIGFDYNKAVQKIAHFTTRPPNEKTPFIRSQPISSAGPKRMF